MGCALRVEPRQRLRLLPQQMQDYPRKTRSSSPFSTFSPAFGLDLGPNGNFRRAARTTSISVRQISTFAAGTTSSSARVKRSSPTRISDARSGRLIYDEFDTCCSTWCRRATMRSAASAAARSPGNISTYFAFAQDDWKVTPNYPQPRMRTSMRVPRDVINQELNRIAEVPA